MTDTVAALRPEAAPALRERARPTCCSTGRWEMRQRSMRPWRGQPARVVTLDLVNNRLAPVTLEPRAALGTYDPCVRMPADPYKQQPGRHILRDWLVEVFHLPAARIRVVFPDVGGGFGMRLFLYPEHVLVLFAARRLQRPVGRISRRQPWPRPSQSRIPGRGRRWLFSSPESGNGCQYRRRGLGLRSVRADLEQCRDPDWCLRHPGSFRSCPGGLDQHRTGGCLSGRWPAGDRLSA